MVMAEIIIFSCGIITTLAMIFLIGFILDNMDNTNDE